MKLVALLLVTLSNQGYWFGGEPATITLRPAVQGLPNADIVWELRFDGVTLDHGSAAVLSDGKDIEIHPKVPKVRVRVAMHWLYRVVAREPKKELETGDVPVSIFPDDLIQGFTARFGARRLMVYDKAEGLPKLLESAGISCVQVSAVQRLEFARPDDVVLVGQEMLTDSPFEQAPLINLAEAGASVMVFHQSEPGRLMGYPLAHRAAPTHLGWRMDHPLLAGFEREDLQSWIAAVASLQVIQLPADEPALETGFYSREIAGKEPAPIDAVLVSKSVGNGRIVLCQIPLGDWKNDPRSQMLLRNALDYLLTRPQPTPRPSDRPVVRPAEKLPSRTNLIIPGDQP